MIASKIKKHDRLKNIGICYSCGYFFKNNTTLIQKCWCTLIKDGDFTINQAINGLRIFKSEMKKYLKEKQRCPGA